MDCLEVFRLLYDFLFAQQPFLLAKLNPQLLKGPNTAQRVALSQASTTRAHSAAIAQASTVILQIPTQPQQRQDRTRRRRASG